MVTATSSRRPKAEGSGPLERLGCALAAAPGERILFALQFPELPRIAWRSGRSRALSGERRARAAFAEICRRTLRRGDAIAHETGSNLFLAALVGNGVRSDVRRTARAVLGEIMGQLSRELGWEVEGGWTLFVPGDDPATAVREAATAALERGRRERERFAFFATFGHEMRTPLASVDGYLAALLENELDPPMRRRFTEIAQLETVRLRRLVESMYALSLIDLDREIVRDVWCDAQQAVESACDAIYPAAARRGTRVRVCSRIEAAIPLPSEYAVQMFLGLLENAVKHGRENGRVEVYLEERGGDVTLSFEDDGPGVPADQHSTIFEPLVRGRGTTTAGHGLGLSIVRTTIERADGHIAVSRSALGGARFTVTFPRGARGSACPTSIS